MTDNKPKPHVSSTNYNDNAPYTNTPKDPYGPSDAPTEMFDPVTPENIQKYEENTRHNTSRQSNYEQQYNQPRDPYYNREHSPQYSTYDEYDKRPRQYFPNEPQTGRTTGNDYITRNEILEDENQRLKNEFNALQNKKHEDDEEFNSLQEDFKKKDSLYKTFLFTTLLVGFLAIVLLFWHPLGAASEADSAAKDAKISQLQGEVDKLTKDRDEAVKNTGDTNGRVTELQEQLNSEKDRADEAERNAKNLSLIHI